MNYLAALHNEYGKAFMSFCSKFNRIENTQQLQYIYLKLYLLSIIV